MLIMTTSSFIPNKKIVHLTPISLAVSQDSAGVDHSCIGAEAGYIDRRALSEHLGVRNLDQRALWLLKLSKFCPQWGLNQELSAAQPIAL